MTYERPVAVRARLYGFPDEQEAARAIAADLRAASVVRTDNGYTLYLPSQCMFLRIGFERVSFLQQCEFFPRFSIKSNDPS